MEQVFIIDDDKANNYLCKLVLEDCGIKPQTVYSFYLVNEALNTLHHAVEVNANFPDLILLDINLPGADGWDFLTHFRNFPIPLREHTKIFMLSSSIYPDDIERSKTYPEIIEFLPKPLTTELVERIVSEHFSNSRYQA
ncbi:MAG: response regulator [Chitinophagales bacterium]|nr:response regulator [Chitinophagales bacterium]